MEERKIKKIIFIAGGSVAFIFVGIILYNIFIAKKTGIQILTPPMMGISKEELPPVPDLRMKYSIFDTITKIFGSEPMLVEGVPVEEGEHGKVNPFESFDFMEPSPNQSPTNSPPSLPSDIGQGTK